MNYFEAKRAECFFRTYKDLATKYWSLSPEDTRNRRDRAMGAPHHETEGSTKLREQINQMLSEVNFNAYSLGIGVNVQSYPPPVTGGPVVPVNILGSVVDQKKGHQTISRTLIIDKIDQCIGTAKSAKRRGFWRLVIPVFWIIDVPALIIRVPFLILRAAGLPAKVEENIISHILKAIIMILFLLLVGYLGLEKHITHILNIFK